MKKLTFARIAALTAVFCVATAFDSPAQSAKMEFNGVDGDHSSQDQTYSSLELRPVKGEFPNSPLVQGASGALYGTAQGGGNNYSASYCNPTDYCGTFFEITPEGKQVSLYDFCSQANCADGGIPIAAPALGPDGNFYGTTSSGGANNLYPCQLDVGCGTIFKISPAGDLTTLYNFCSQANCADGVYASNLVLGINGNFYGTTESGGILNGDAGCPLGCGTVFEVSPQGQFTTVYTFCSKEDRNGLCTDGVIPTAGLVLASNGNFYGTTSGGGTRGVGNIFEITPGGKLTQIYSFCSQANCADGGYPKGALIQASDGNLYGATTTRGAYDYGTIFRISLGGVFSTVYSFCSSLNDQGACADGAIPQGIIQGSDGNLYGVTDSGGNATAGLCGGAGSGCGTFFELTLAGDLTTLYEFCAQTGCTDGAYPSGIPLQDTNGNFYGTTGKGGHAGCYVGGGCGVAYSLSVNLAPFVAPVPEFGKVGQAIGILGNDLAAATAVTFSGTPAKFLIGSGTLIEAEVPAGTTSGTIQVTTSHGTLSSNVPFQAVP